MTHHKISWSSLVDTPSALLDVVSQTPGPGGRLPLSEELLREAPSGDLFGWTQDVGMGWNPAQVNRAEFLILSTQGGIRAPDGRPIDLGYHTGHWEVGLLMQAAAEEFKSLGAIPFAGFCTDPCDGRTQGTTGMMDSLPYRNDAAQVLRRLIRSLPTRAGVLGVATCDKGLPAMMMALAAMHDLPCVLVPGGVTLPPTEGEGAGKVQPIGARFAHGELTLEQAAELGCRACGSPGGGCQFLGTAATSQVVAEALGMTLPHAALAPSGQPIWLDMARRSARAVLALARRGLTMNKILTDAALRNAMAVHAAVGGSTNLLLHIPAVAYSAGLKRPTVVDSDGVYRKTGPARVFLSERAAVAAIKSTGPDRVKAGDVVVLICRGPMGAGMEEIYQITSALKHLSFGKHVAVLTDARFSGVSTGACIGHIGPEALAGGPIGKVRDGDRIRIIIDRNRLEGSVDLVGEGEKTFGPEEGTCVLASRVPRPDLAADPNLPDDTRLWAALQSISGGTWGGC